jgi:adenosine deaminase
MTGQQALEPIDYYQKLPKVELHRHLEGSLRVQTIKELSRTYGITLPPSHDLTNLIQVQKSDPLTFKNFLSKFQILRLFYLTPEIIQRITYEAIQDAADDHVLYMELMFTPVALSRARGFSLVEVFDWVLEAVKKANKELTVQTRLIASVNRHESPDLAEEVAQLAVERRSQGIVGLNLAGNEAEFSAHPFKKIFIEAHKNGLGVTIHAGEWNGPQNVKEAIKDFRAQRIGHGVRILENPALVKLACKTQTPFEICITSNYQTGVLSAPAAHPLAQMLEAGLNVTLNTDDPSVSNITLSSEYCLACEKLGLKRQVLTKLILSAAEATFLPADEKTGLVERIKSQLPLEDK